MKAAEAYHMKKFAIAGGVASNQALRTAMQKACEEQGLVFLSSVSDLLYR